MGCSHPSAPFPLPKRESNEEFPSAFVDITNETFCLLCLTICEVFMLLKSYNQIQVIGT